MNDGIEYKCVAFDIDTNTSEEIHHIWIEEEKPEKVYPDHIDHYGDIRDSWRAV